MKSHKLLKLALALLIFIKIYGIILIEKEKKVSGNDDEPHDLL